MAPDNAESLSDLFAPGDSAEPSPDSNALRVSTNTQHESGVPPARTREESLAAEQLARELTLEGGALRMDTVLSNVVRTEANLSLLVRGLKHLSASAQAARAANTELMHELDELRTHLTRSHEEEQAVRFRMSQLEQLLDIIRHESKREREFLIEQQDLFLVEILTDHERQLGDLQHRLRSSSQSPLESEKLAELIAQRDQAREYAARCERERDLAWQELAAAAAVPVVPAERAQRSPSAATAIGAISLRSVSVSASGPAPSAAQDTVRSSERAATGYSLSREEISE